MLGFLYLTQLTQSDIELGMINSSSDLEESLWIEVLNGTKMNIVCGIVYRHPNTSLQSFLDHFPEILDKVHKESKLCITMGEFNINLLNCNSHASTSCNEEIAMLRNTGLRDISPDEVDVRHSLTK